MAKPPKINIRYFVQCEGENCGTDGEVYEYREQAEQARRDHRQLHREGELD